MNTAKKGNATEAAVLSALANRGFDVLVPFGGGQPYDPVLHVKDTKFLRVQCKTARVVKGCLRFNSRSTDHGRGAGTYAGLADMFGVFCSRSGDVYLVPVSAVPRWEAFLRLEPARNNQGRRVRQASDFAIDGWGEGELLRFAEAAVRGRRRILCSRDSAGRYSKRARLGFHSA